MIDKVEIEKLINTLKGKLDETQSALVSDELLATLSAYNNGFDEYTNLLQEIENLKQEKEELLKVNGKLYQKIGFEDEEEKEEEAVEEAEEEIAIEDVVNEKGELI